MKCFRTFRNSSGIETGPMFDILLESCVYCPVLTWELYMNVYNALWEPH